MCTYSVVVIVYCNHIGEDDLEKIRVEVKSIVDNQGLGLALGIRMSAIQTIMQNDNRLNQRRMILFHWLTRKDIILDKQGQVPTWSLLAEAVEEESPVIAEAIRSKYKTKAM